MTWTKSHSTPGPSAPTAAGSSGGAAAERVHGAVVGKPHRGPALDQLDGRACEEPDEDRRRPAVDDGRADDEDGRERDALGRDALDRDRVGLDEHRGEQERQEASRHGQSRRRGREGPGRQTRQSEPRDRYGGEERQKPGGLFRHEAPPALSCPLRARWRVGEHTHFFYRFRATRPSLRPQRGTRPGGRLRRQRKPALPSSEAFCPFPSPRSRTPTTIAEYSLRGVRHHPPF